MRVRTQYSGLETEFYIYADEHRCDEFMLPSQRSRSNNDSHFHKECFVQVSENQHIMVVGHLSGRLSRARFDLIADGSFVGSRMVEAEKDGRAKLHTRRRIEFRSVNSIIADPFSKKTAQSKVVGGELVAQTLEGGTSVSYMNGPSYPHGVGSLVVIISLEESYSNEGYWPESEDYPDRILGNWRHRESEVQQTGIMPTHYMGMQNVNYNVIPQKCNKFQQQYEGTRYGFKPFAKLVFLYRSKAAILQQRCMPLPQKAYLVPESYPESSPVTSQPSEVEGGSEDEATEALFMSPTLSAASAVNGKPKRRLGGLLVLPGNMISQPRSLLELALQQEAERREEQYERIRGSATTSERPAGVTSGFFATHYNARRKPCGFGGPSDAGYAAQSTAPPTADEEYVAQSTAPLTIDEEYAAQSIAPHTVDVGGTEWLLPALDSFDALIGSNGIRLSLLLQYVFPGLAEQHIREAALCLRKHIKESYTFTKDQHGRLICLRKADIPPYDRVSGKRIPSPTSLELPPNKRMHSEYADSLSQHSVHSIVYHDQNDARQRQEVLHLSHPDHGTEIDEVSGAPAVLDEVEPKPSQDSTDLMYREEDMVIGRPGVHYNATEDAADTTF